MKLINKLTRVLLAVTILFSLGNRVVLADEIESGIYSLENDVYHESDIGMSMSRSYLEPTMEVEVRSSGITYTIGFLGSEYMENYRMKLSDEEVPVEIITEGVEEGTVKLKVEVDKLDADMEALIYVGPMERDVEFSVIPKLETLTLIEAIEEESEVIEEEQEESVDESKEDTTEEVELEEEKSYMPLVIGGVVVIVALGVGFTIFKSKRNGDK